MLEQFIQNFSVDDTIISGTEELTVLTNNHYYNSTDSISVTISMDNLNPTTEYTVELKLCWQRWHFQFPLTSSGTTYEDRSASCHEVSRPIIYDAENNIFEEELGTKIVPSEVLRI